MTTTHAETLRTLITVPVCTDAVVDRLLALAGDGKDARLLSDLAAAYYVRAQRDDRASDLVRSLHAAQKAVKRNSRLPAAQFNLALAEESLGFSAFARKTWETAGSLDRSPWSLEAVARRTEIDRQSARNAAAAWSLNRQRLPRAVRTGDLTAIRRLIQPFPAATQRYLEEDVLPAWADAPDAEAPALLHDASVIAKELRKLTGDPYLSEALDCIERSRGQALETLKRAHKAFGKARRLERAFDFVHAAPAYDEAAGAFARAGSPLRAGAALGHAIQRSFITADKAELLRTLAELETRVHAKGYLSLEARIQANRANFLQSAGRYLEALALYEPARQTFERVSDEESLANVHTRKGGIFRVLGHDAAAMNEVLLAQRYSDKLVEFRHRHLLAGETAATVLALGYPSIALTYQTAFIDALREELNNAPGDPETKDGLRVNLAIALNSRAAIRLHLQEYDTARTELDEASSITRRQADGKIRSALRACIAEVRGRAALPANPKLAIEAFTEAIALSGPVRYRTLQTILLTQRAEAHRLAGQAAEAERDLRDAIEELRAEEADLLAGRRRGEGEGLWADYFSRFQESYERLIGQLVERGRKEEAFAYAEKSRAFEPLKLVLELPVSSEVFQSINTRSAGPLSLEQIQASLPLGTFVLEYQVTKSHTYVWVLSRDDLELITLPVGRESIEGWSRSLQKEAVGHDFAAFERQLAVPFAALLEQPLAALGGMRFGRHPERRVVIVPDMFMHGLPFAALRDAKAGRYLVEDFPVSVAASATLYVYALERDRELAVPHAPSALLIGDPAFDETLELAQGLTRLRHARAEAEEVGKLYAPRARVLVDKDATVPAFLQLSKTSDIVHVAGHAIANRHAPFGTLLLMAPSKNHSGLLYAEELLKELELDQARLVVLSACSSAGGVPVGPEGLAPLVRPIVTAGVPGVVGSLWTINDAMSQPVLVEFHRQYRNGHDAARALQLAQIRFLRERKASIPVAAWAPFQVVGQASSPFPAQH